LSGCGHTLNVYNDTVNNFVVNSLEYWLTEFDVDGFRFDLMGIFPVHRLIEWADRLRKIKPGILLYGEPWAGYHDHPDYWMDDKAIERNACQLSDAGIGVFNSHFRDTMIRHFVNGDSQNLGNATGPVIPVQSINYITCHDGYCLSDMICRAGQWDAWKVAKEVISFQCETPGALFIFSGDEFLRSKGMARNTWNLGDEYNAIDWSYKTKNKQVFDCYRDQVKGACND
jgi:pullulanase